MAEAGGEPATSDPPAQAEPKAAPSQRAAEEGPKSESWRDQMNKEGKEKRKRMEEERRQRKQGRQYAGWLDANNIEWRTKMEYIGQKKWEQKFGACTEWGERYKQWICSNMTRPNGLMRKPSFRALEWLKYKRGYEVAPVGECCTRKRSSIRDYFVEPLDNYCCRPCPWPKTTSGEYGWLGQHESCQLEIYKQDFMQKPPLPWWQRKISSYLPGTM